MLTPTVGSPPYPTPRKARRRAAPRHQVRRRAAPRHPAASARLGQAPKPSCSNGSSTLSTAQCLTQLTNPSSVSSTATGSTNGRGCRRATCSKPPSPRPRPVGLRQSARRRSAFRQSACRLTDSAHIRLSSEVYFWLQTRPWGAPCICGWAPIISSGRLGVRLYEGSCRLFAFRVGV